MFKDVLRSWLIICYTRMSIQNDDIITFRRSRSSTPPHEGSSESWWEGFFSFPHEVSFFFDGNLETTPMRGDEAKAVEDKSSGKGQWDLEYVWLNDIDGGAKGKVGVLC